MAIIKKNGGQVITVSCPFCGIDNSQFEQHKFSRHLTVCPDAPRGEAYS